MLEACSQFCIVVCVQTTSGDAFGTKGGMLGCISLLMVSGAFGSLGDNLKLSSGVVSLLILPSRLDSLSRIFFCFSQGVLLF